MSDLPKLDYAGPDLALVPKRALATIFLIVFIDLLGFGIIIPLLPFYAMSLKASPLQVTMLFSIFSICQFVAAPVLGAISDRYGRRGVLAFSQLAGMSGYILLGFTTHHHWLNLSAGLWMMYLARAIPGIAGGSISTAQAYISDVTTPANRARGMGMLGAAFGLGFAAGPGIGGILGHHFGPSIPAYAAAGMSLLAATLTFILLPESRVHRPLAVEAWLHPSRFAPVLKRPVLIHLLLISFVSMSAFVMMEAVLAMYLNARLHFEMKHVGWLFAFTGVVIIIVQGGVIGRLTRVTGEWPLAIVGPLLVACGMVGYAAAGMWGSLAVLLIAAAVNATGRSLQQPTISSLLSQYSDPREQGIVFGLYQGMGSLARVAGPVIAGLAYAKLKEGPLVLSAAIAGLTALWTLGVRVKMGTRFSDGFAIRSTNKIRT